LEDIFNYVELLDKLGIYTSFQCNPINAGITTLDEILDLVYMAAQAGLKHIIFKFTEQVANARQVIIDRLYERRFEKERVLEFDRLFNQVVGGVYTIQQDVRVEWLWELLKATRDAGLTMSTCYEYYDDGKAGANLAPWFTTSRGGCHGQIVPVHYRLHGGSQFKPLQGCFESGCLYCEEHGTQACKSDTLIQAKALEYKDLRVELDPSVDTEASWALHGSAPAPDKMPRGPHWFPKQLSFAEYYGWGKCPA
jgi:hypothetical protein